MFVLCSCDFCISLVPKLHLNQFQKCIGMRLLHGRSFIRSFKYDKYNCIIPLLVQSQLLELEMILLISKKIEAFYRL